MLVCFEKRGIYIYIYMLYAGWEVRVVKKLMTEVLKMLPEVACGLSSLSSPRSQFSTIRSDPKAVNNLFIFSKLSNEKKKLMQVLL